MNVYELDEGEAYEVYDTRSDLKMKQKSYSTELDMKRISKKSWNCQPKLLIPFVLLILLNAVLSAAVLVLILYFQLHAGSQLSDIGQRVSQVNESTQMSLNNLSQSLQMDVVGKSPQYPASSCSSLSRQSPSDYYWIESSNGSSILVYCDMTKMCGNITGGWMRVTQLNMKNTFSQCPPGLCLNTSLPQTCRICNFTGGCSSDVFQVQVNYSHVCGRVIGYQIGTTDAFSMEYSNGFDGVSLSYGNDTIIWTFAAANREDYAHPNSVCPCINPADSQIPSVPSKYGNNYFCDTGTRTGHAATFYRNNPLWDGMGCTSPHNACCSFNNPPWFYRNLLNPTPEPITMRVCRSGNRDSEDVGIEIIDLFVQ